MTTFCPAYDTETVPCLEAVRRIVDVHEQHDMPATFFVVANLLDEMEMLHGIFRYVRERQLSVATFTEYCQSLNSDHPPTYRGDSPTCPSLT